MKKDLKEIIIKDEDNRLINGYASVEIVDKQGDIVPIDALEKAMLDYMNRGGNILYGHENKPVGKVLQWNVEKHPELDVPAISLVAMIFKDYKISDEIWKLIHQNALKGFSIGGTALQTKEAEIPTKGKVRVLNELELSEISVVAEPANQAALIEHVSIAKSDDVKKDIIDDILGDKKEVKYHHAKEPERWSGYRGEEFGRKSNVYHLWWDDKIHNVQDLVEWLNKQPADKVEEFLQDRGELLNYQQSQEAGMPQIYRIRSGSHGTSYYVRYQDGSFYPYDSKNVQYLKEYNDWAAQFKEKGMDEMKFAEVVMDTWLFDFIEKGREKPSYEYLNYCTAKVLDSIPEINTELNARQFCGYLYWYKFNGDRGLSNAWAFENGKISQDDVERWEIFHRIQHQGENPATKPEGWKMVRTAPRQISTAVSRLGRRFNRGDTDIELQSREVAKVSDNEMVEILKPFAGFPNWEACVRQVKSKSGYSDKVAAKVCGSLKHRYEKMMRGGREALEKKSYPWEECIKDQKANGHDEESANKICGSIKEKYGKGDVIGIEYIPLVVDIISKAEEDLEKFKAGGIITPDKEEALEWQDRHPEGKVWLGDDGKWHGEEVIGGEVSEKSVENFKYSEDISDGMEKDDADGIGNTFDECVENFSSSGMDSEKARDVCGYLRYTNENKSLVEKERGKLLSLLRRKRVKKESEESDMTVKVKKDGEEEIVPDNKEVLGMLKQIKDLLEKLVGEKAALGDKEEVEEVEELTEKANIGSQPAKPQSLPEDAFLSQTVRSGVSIPEQSMVESDASVGGKGKFNNVSGGLKTGVTTSDKPVSPDAGGVKTVKGSISKGKVPEIPFDNHANEEGIYSGGGIDIRKGLEDVLTGKKNARAVTRGV